MPAGEATILSSVAKRHHEGEPTLNHFSSPRRGRFSLATGLLAAILLAAFVSAACGGDDSSPKSTVVSPKIQSAAGAYPITVTDSSGVSVTVTEAPKRIISYSPGITETLFAVGAGSQVVAVDRFSDYPAATNALPKLEYSKPAPEPALGLNPDLVFMTSRQEGEAPQFRAAGLKVLMFKEPASLPSVADQFDIVGKLTGHDAEGAKASADLRTRIAAIGTRVAKVDKGPSVFIELDAAGFTVSPDTFIGSMLTLLKAGNIAAGASSQFPQLSAEAIIAANPDVIILADAGNSGGQSPALVKGRPGWSGIAAVKNGRVYEVDGDTLSRPGPRVVEALEALAKQLYPDLK